MRSDVEETDNHKDVTDSGYSNSCSNSHSQRSGSSKCSGRNSAGSSGSGSSTFCVLPSTIESGQKDGKERKEKKKDQDKKGKKKKNKSVERGSSTVVAPILPLSDEEPKFTSGNTCQVNSAIPTVPQLMETGTEDNNLQAAALSQTLHTMRKMKYDQENGDETEGSDKDGAEANVKHLLQGEKSTFEITLEQIASLKSDALHEGEITIAVSMLDGVVIYTSGLTHSLGYPNDMWIGRSLIDFIHPKHRASFASFIIQSIAEQYPGNSGMNGQSNFYFCCLRKYRGLKNGFQVTEQKVNYLPCQITLKFKDLPHNGDSSLKECLVVTAAPVRSAYKYSDETRMSPKFMTRHSVKCQLVHVDPEVMPYFGFLPQDMLSRSVLDFYHPEDMHFLKEVYEAVIKEQGHPFRSKPYRFMCQNGGYALVETELSSFINPWTRKLEFIIGQHSVLRGPSNPDVTTPCSDPKPLNISEEVLKETKIVQEEIKCLLNETVVRSTETAKQQVSKRCKDLAAFMENLMDEITKPPDLKVVVPTEEQSFSERDSVMLGEISPHHDYYDSKSMSETPPSYNQLNYNENIHRFFESKPKTTVSDESSRSGADNKTGSSGEEGKITPTVNSSSGSKSGDSGASSGQSTGSNGHSGETTSNDASNNSNNTEGYKPPALTEQLLSRHNEDMEKQMVQKHRVSRTKTDRESKVKERMKSLEKCQDTKNCNVEEPAILVISQGVKRSGSHSWEGEPYKSIKASHPPPAAVCPQQPQPSCVSEPPLLATAAKNSLPIAAPLPSSSIVGRPSQIVTGAAPTSTIWPPFPIGSPTPVPASPSQDFSGMTLGGLMPMYYRRPEGSTSAGYPMPTSNPMSYPQPPVHLMSSLLYQPFMYGTPPIQVYSPVMYPTAAFNVNTIRCSPQQKLAASTELDTNMKPPGGVPTPGPQPTTSVETPFARNQQKSNDENGSNEISTPYDDSSYQSSFYSFLKTDSKSDESMKSSSENEKLEEQEWRNRRDAKNRPVRKVAPWIENVNVTPDLMLKYQLKERGLEETLKNDAAALENIKQPSLVNDQLSQMYQDLELEGHSMALNLDEGITSSSESSGDDTKVTKCSLENSAALKKQKRYMEYDKMTILFEEDAPMPPPVVTQCS